MNNVENVVYRYNPDEHPAVRYHAIPSGCAGGANDLGAARSSYRSDLIGLLHVDRHDLPPVIEHLEAVVDGMWVRSKVGAVHRDRSADRMFLQTLLAPGSARKRCGPGGAGYRPGPGTRSGPHRVGGHGRVGPGPDDAP